MHRSDGKRPIVVDVAASGNGSLGGDIHSADIAAGCAGVLVLLLLLPLAAARSVSVTAGCVRLHGHIVAVGFAGIHADTIGAGRVGCMGEAGSGEQGNGDDGLFHDDGSL